MYQSEMKEGFIEDYLRSRFVARTSLNSLFKKTEPFEKENGKDCSQFNENEILKMYTEFNAKTIYVLMNYNTILKAYCAWKKYYHKENTTNAYNNLTIEMLKPCVPQNSVMFLSREEIINIENQIYNWTDRAIIECLWEGISGPSMIDLVSINQKMIDTENKILYFPDGRLVKLTDRLYDLLTKAFDEKEYVCYSKDLMVIKLNGENKLYKKLENTHARDSNDKYFRWVYRKVRNCRDHVGMPGLTMKNIQTSGMYYYLCRGIQETGLDLRSFLKSEDGECLMDKYGFQSKYRVDNVYHHFQDYI